MAYGKMRQKLFVFFTCIILIECRSVLELSGTQGTNDGGGGNKSEHSMSDHEGFVESLVDYEHLGDDPSVAGQVSSSEAAWDTMSPKLRCDEDLMKLQLSGPEVAQIELCRGNGAPVPLVKLPPHCGHTTPSYGGLVYATPYDGCGIMQQGGSYVLRMQWQGNSAVISCPMISTAANETFLGPLTPAYLQILLPHSPLDALSSAADTMLEPSTIETGEPVTPISQEILKPQPPGYSQAFLQRFWPYYYHHHQHGKSESPEKPIVSSILSDDTVDQAPIQKPQPPGYPQDFWLYYHQGKTKPPEKPVPTSILSDDTVDQAPAQKPQLPRYPQNFWPYYYHHHHGKPKPPEMPIPISIPTDTSVAAQAPAQKPQLPGYPQDFWPYYYHHHHHHHHHGKPKPPEMPVPISIPTDTSVAQAPAQKPQLPGYQQDFWPYYYHHHGKPKPPEIPIPTSMPTTSVAQEPAQKPQIPRYPQDFWPYYYPHHHGKPKPPEIPFPTSMTTTSVAQEPAQKPQIPGYPQDFWLYYYPHHHGKPKLLVTPVPTSMPTTSFAQEPAQKPQIPGYPKDFWPYYYPHYHGKPKAPEKPAPAIPIASLSSSQATTQKLQPPMYPGDVFPHNYYHNYPLYLQPLYSQYPVQPPKTPTMPPITTTPQPCTTPAAAECKPSANQPPNNPPQYYIPFSSILSEKDPIALHFVDFSEIPADSYP